MGVPSKNQPSPCSPSFPPQHPSHQSSKKQAKQHNHVYSNFPHDYIQENRYTVSPDEEQTLCTVYQKTPFENQDSLRESLMHYIDWRCTTITDCHAETRATPNSLSLHLCNHINKGLHDDADKDDLSKFAEVLENDGITRLDLLWNMRSYKKWFDSDASMASVDQVPA